MIDCGLSVFLTADIPLEARDWRNSQELRQGTRESDEISQGRHQNWYNRIINQDKDRMYGIVSKVAEGGVGRPNFPYENYVGVCGLTNIDYIHRHAEWSLYIHKPYQGKGYAKDALKTLCWHGFYNLNFHRIWGEVFSNNPASVAIAEKIGFKLEGRLRETYYKNGAYIDSFIYGLLAKDFRI